jgi:hypothetical protein
MIGKEMTEQTDSPGQPATEEDFIFSFNLNFSKNTSGAVQSSFESQLSKLAASVTQLLLNLSNVQNGLPACQADRMR